MIAPKYDLSHSSVVINLYRKIYAVNFLGAYNSVSRLS